MAEKLNSILNNYVTQGAETKDKILGAAFAVVNKDGKFKLLPHRTASPDRLC